MALTVTSSHWDVVEQQKGVKPGTGCTLHEHRHLVALLSA